MPVVLLPLRRVRVISWSDGALIPDLSVRAVDPQFATTIVAQNLAAALNRLTLGARRCTGAAAAGLGHSFPDRGSLIAGDLPRLDGDRRVSVAVCGCCCCCQPSSARSSWPSSRSSTDPLGLTEAQVAVPAVTTASRSGLRPRTVIRPISLT
jgi:hypothetical protein